MSLLADLDRDAERRLKAWGVEWHEPFVNAVGRRAIFCPADRLVHWMGHHRARCPKCKARVRGNA